MTGCDPRVEPARERPHALQSLLDEDLRGALGGRLVRAIAIDDDLSIGGKIVGARDLVEVEHRGAGNVRPRLVRERRPHVDDERARVRLHPLAQLVDRDQRRVDVARQAPPLPALEAHVEAHDDGDGGHGERRMRIIDDPDAIVDAIFHFYENRGFQPTAEERDKMLNL